MDLIDAARRADIEFVLTRREDSGMIMAAVTALLSNAPGLALATKRGYVRRQWSRVGLSRPGAGPVRF